LGFLEALPHFQGHWPGKLVDSRTQDLRGFVGDGGSLGKGQVAPAFEAGRGRLERRFKLLVGGFLERL
jgi:hypothetical protein